MTATHGVFWTAPEPQPETREAGEIALKFHPLGLHAAQILEVDVCGASFGPVHCDEKFHEFIADDSALIPRYQKSLGLYGGQRGKAHLLVLIPKNDLGVEI